MNKGEQTIAGWLDEGDLFTVPGMTGTFRVGIVDEGSEGNFTVVALDTLTREAHSFAPDTLVQFQGVAP